MPLTTDSPTPTGLRSPLRVRNLVNNPTVFSKQIGGDPFKVTFGAAGTPTDTLRVPLALSEDIDFINSLEMGILEVVGGPAEIVEGLRFETEQIRAERAEAEAKSVDAIDRRQDRDILGATCIGPAAGGRSGTCGRPLLQSKKQQEEQPPLCTEHADLAPNYTLMETGSKGEGATESTEGVVRREWRATTLTAPVRQVQ